MALRTYLITVGMWIRSDLAYRTNFALMVLVQFVITGLDFAAIMIMFSAVDSLGGYGLAEVALLYGASSLSLGLTDLFVGSMEKIGQRVRDGSVDVFLVRPVPVLAQAAADRFGLRRIGRVLQGLVVLVWAVAAVDVDWTPLKAAMVPVAVLCGTAIFAAFFLFGAAFQFWAADAAQVQNAFTYGGNFLTQYPPTVFAKEIVRAAVFLVPLAFVNWLPIGYVLGRDDPLGLPAAVDFASPLVALVLLAAARAAWGAAIRGYRSTGS